MIVQTIARLYCFIMWIMMMRQPVASTNSDIKPTTSLSSPSSGGCVVTHPIFCSDNPSPPLFHPEHYQQHHFFPSTPSLKPPSHFVSSPTPPLRILLSSPFCCNYVNQHTNSSDTFNTGLSALPAPDLLYR